MKRSVLMVVALALVVGGVGQVRATEFLFSYGGTVDGISISGSGTFTGTEVGSSGTYLLTSGTGTSQDGSYSGGSDPNARRTNL